MPARTRILLAAAAFAIAAMVAGTASAAKRPPQILIEAKIVETRLPPRLSQGAATVECGRGKVPLAGGFAADTFVNVTTSMPSGPRGWSVAGFNFADGESQLAASLLCLKKTALVDVLRVPFAGTVPAGMPMGTTFEPGAVELTPACPKGRRPVGAGFDFGSEWVLDVRTSTREGQNGWKVVVENFSTVGGLPVEGELACLKVSPKVKVRGERIELEIEPGVLTGGVVEPGVASGTAKCRKGETLLGFGMEQEQRVRTGELGGKPPALGTIPILGYVFRNNAQSTAKAELLIFCTPRIVKS